MALHIAKLASTPERFSRAPIPPVKLLKDYSQGCLPTGARKNNGRASIRQINAVRGAFAPKHRTTREWRGRKRFSLGELLQRFQSDLGRPVPPRKNIPLSSSGKSPLSACAVSPRIRGADRESSRTRGGVRWTRQRWVRDELACRRTAPMRTAKSCGSGIRC